MNVKKTRVSILKKRRLLIVHQLIKDVSKYLNLDIKKSDRSQGFDKSLWNRAVFYYFLNVVRGYDGLDISKALSIHHSTGIHYRDSMTPFFKSDYPKDFNDKIELFKELYEKSYFKTFTK